MARPPSTLLRERKSDLVLTDMAMKPMDGLEFTRHVRNHEHSPNPFVPIIMITGHTEKHRVEAARDAGVTEFLAKPITAAQPVLAHRRDRGAPRAFVRCDSYFGPDRRRRQIDDYAGPWRRKRRFPGHGCALMTRQASCRGPVHRARRLSPDDEQAATPRRPCRPCARAQTAVKAQVAMEAAVPPMRAAILQYVDELEDAGRRHAQVFDKVHEIRGFAETAGLVTTGRIADILCRYMDDM